MSNEITTTATTSVALASSAENVSAIVRDTPGNFSRNQLSYTRCLMAGEKLIEEIREKGMSDELDQLAAKYIEKTRRTIKDMNERRSPLTKLFDQMRKEFTELENSIDPTRDGTVPFRIQQLRNRFAAERRQQEEARRRAEEIRRQAELARTRYRAECTDDFKARFNELVDTHINHLTSLERSLTLQNYDTVLDAVTAFAVDLAPGWTPQPSLHVPLNITDDESAAIRSEILQELMPRFAEQYRAEIGDYRQDILDRLPSRKAELERASKAEAAEAARIKTDMEQRHAAVFARMEAQRAARLQEDVRKTQAAMAGTEAANLFDLARATAPAYQPKAKVSKRISVTAPSGYMQVLAMWWAKEGCNLTKDELDKVFKKQITFCEKVANKEGEFINDPGVEYVDEVKAQ